MSRYAYDKDTKELQPIASNGGGEVAEMTGATASADGTGGTVPQPHAGDEDKFLKANGSWANVPTPSTMTGASSTAAGASGLVPTPSAGDEGKVLQGNGTWGAYLPLSGGALTGTLEVVNVVDKGCTLTANTETKGSHAEGHNTTVEYSYSHAEGSRTYASSIAHAEGWLTKANFNYAHAEGEQTTAFGEACHAEGGSTRAGAGYGSGGDCAHAEGISTTAYGTGSHAEGCGTCASTSYQHVSGRFNLINSALANEANRFIIGKGSSNTARANSFRVYDSGVYGAGAYNSSGADYAELFEWADGNKNNEDRAGKFVTLDGDKIKFAKPSDKYILGVVSGYPSVVGDVFDDQWQGMFMTDIFGRPIYEEVEVEAEYRERENPETGEIEKVEIRPAHTETRQKVNPNYDNTTEYKPRTERAEWDAVGVLGKLVCIDDGTCEINGYAKVSEDSIATASDERTKIRVMKRLDESHIQIFIM